MVSIPPCIFAVVVAGLAPAKTATNQYGTPCTSPRAWLSVTLASELCIGFVLHATTELTTSKVCDRKKNKKLASLERPVPIIQI